MFASRRKRLIHCRQNFGCCHLDVVHDSDTENDDTMMSTRSQHTAAAATAAARLDDIIDDDSDFEVSSKQRVSTSAGTRQDAAKYYTCTIMIS